MSDQEFDLYSRALLFLGRKMCEHNHVEAIQMVAVRVDSEESRKEEEAS